MLNRRPPFSALRAAALAAVAGLALSACTGSTSPSSSGTASTPTPAAQETAAAPRLSIDSPFNGLPLTHGVPRYPVMVVKMDNSASSKPQVGLSGADMVLEELVEGGITRLALVFWSHTPDVVGPVRSMRATDIGIVLPAHGVLVAAGGAPPTRQRVSAAHIRTYGEGAPGFYRVSDRLAPYNLFVHLDKLAKALRAKSQSLPEPYLPFGAARLPHGSKARSFEAWFSSSSVTRWSYSKGHYTNTNTNGLPKDQFVPSTVLVLRVRIGDAGYLDPAHNHVPETYFTGSGQAMVFHGGRLVRATWHKAGYNAPVRLSTKQGQLSLPPGKVWIELVPASSGRVDVQKK